MFFTAVYLISRSSHFTLDREAPYFTMHTKEADMTLLCAVGA